MINRNSQIFAKISVLVLATIALSSCIKMMKEVQDVPIVEPITVSYKVNAATGFIPKGGSVTPDPNFSTAGVKVTFTNRYDSKADFEQSFSRFKDYAASRDFSSVEQSLTGEIVTELCEDIFNKSVVNW